VDMNVNKTVQSEKPAYSLLLALLAIVILLAMGVGLLSLGLHGRIFAIRTTSDIAARCAADAGLTKAVFEMNEKLKVKPWSDGTLPQAADEALPNCDATFSCTVTADGNGIYTIESIGKSGQAQRKVYSALKLEGLFEYAIYVQESMVLRNGTSITMYNSGADDPSLQIGTNSTLSGAITSKTGVTIDGDVVVGVDGDPDVVINSTSEAVITGDAYSGFEENEMPSITVPAWLQALPSQGTITSSTTITTSGKYDGILLGGKKDPNDPNYDSSKSGKTITIDGPVELYVIGDVILNNSCQIQIVDANTNPNASLTLYLGGKFVCKNGGSINNLSGDPHKLKIYGLNTCLSILFMTDSIFYGAIYAPNADIQLDNSVTFYGAAVGWSFTQNVNANFFYDASLRVVSPQDIGVHWVVKRWRE